MVPSVTALKSYLPALEIELPNPMEDSVAASR
jgi:hypothetical protein